VFCDNWPLPLVQALLQSQAYSHEGLVPNGVELVETHLSYLFLTGEHVYKVKKAVDLGFLDYIDLETRRHFCHEEVTVNRDGDSYSINGPGATVEYAVKIRQLPREQMLGVRLRNNGVTVADVETGAQDGANVWLIECTATEDVVRERLERRAQDASSVSGATWPVYVEQKARWEPVTERSPSRHIVLDTGNGTDESTRRLIYEVFAHTIAA
jgi:hypothetical protein